MNGSFDFIEALRQLLLLVGVAVVVIAFLEHLRLMALTASMRDALSNVGVECNKQATLINQAIHLVNGCQDFEKLEMLVTSDAMMSAGQTAQACQQSNRVFSAASGVAQEFPELVASKQYRRLIDSIQDSEAQLERARLKYNAAVIVYNVKCSSIPHIFYAATLGFNLATCLEFDEATPLVDVDSGTHHGLYCNDDGVRINGLLERWPRKTEQWCK